MGWKGTVRSINAELKRQSREADKRQRQQFREDQKKDARSTVQAHDFHLNEIVSYHHYCNADFDWEAIENTSEPVKPKRGSDLCDEATDKFKNFQPNIVHKALKIEKWRKNSLEKNIEKAKGKDEEIYLDKVAKYKMEKQQWDEDRKLLKKIKLGGQDLLSVIEKRHCIDKIEIGETVLFEINKKNQLDISLKVFSFDELIPDEDYSLRQSGTLSTKKMPKWKGLSLYQDYVCSSLLRVAREVFGTVPVDLVRANAVLSMLNKKTGHLEDQVILSSIITKETLEKINLLNIDPSDSMDNFIHNMKFKKTVGFDSVEKAKFPK